MIKIISFILAILLSQYSFAQTIPTVTTTVKSTATLAALCTISSQNIAFGQISLPVNAQSATSNMTVRCTKGSPYTIGLAYGGSYGTGTVNSNPGYTGSYYVVSSYPYQGASWLIQQYNSSGSQTAEELINSSGSAIGGQNGLFQLAAAQGYTLGKTGTFGTQNPTTTTYYNYGVMNGAAHGDMIAYAIQVPGNPSEVWNTGNYNYTSTGTGSSQSISMTATIVPSKTTNQYPIADTYLDVVTATITY